MHDVLDMLDLCMGGKGVSAFFDVYKLHKE